MKDLHIFRFSVIVVTLSFLLVATGCAGNVPVTEQPTAVTASPAPVASATPVAEATIAPTAMVVPVSGGDVLYQDDFTDPSTGWTEDKFDNYFVGYHEPEYYHIEVTSPNYKTTMFAPGKKSFSDVTLELQVLTNSTKTSPTGDFRYGLAFRRAGDQYYAFTVSPRTKKWFVLKSSPNALVVLKEGVDQDIHDLDTDDALRVDAKGSDFAFHINDQLVAQITDADYAAGEVGFYVESFDSQNTHIHFELLDRSQVRSTGRKSTVVFISR